MLTYSLAQTADPASEPVTTAEAKKHLELLATDSTHDDAIDAFIQAAREQVEHDTGYILIQRTHTLSFAEFPSGDGCIPLPVQPVSAITSLTYYDTDNSQQTLGTGVYGLDADRRLVYLKYDQEWPSITEQHNGIVVTMTTGYGTSASDVPEHFKQAILLQVGKWFEHRDMTESERNTHDRSYERIVLRRMNPHYI